MHENLHAFHRPVGMAYTLHSSFASFKWLFVLRSTPYTSCPVIISAYAPPFPDPDKSFQPASVPVLGRATLVKKRWIVGRTEHLVSDEGIADT